VPPLRRPQRTALALPLLLGVLTSGCGGGAGAGAVAGRGDGDGGAAGVPAATDRCAAVEFPPVQFGSHLLGDADPPVPYSSSPPSSGWHLSGAPTTGVAAQPMSEPAQVSTLEAGGVVITHAGLAEDEIAALSAFAEAHPDTVAVTPYPDLSAGEVVLASWGALQRCDGVDEAALEAYVAAYGNDVTTFEEPGAG
jgi:hypothetical protein